MCRKVLSNFFSKRAITAVEPLVKEHIDRAIDLLERSGQEGKTVNLSLIFHAMTIDIISHYAYGEDYRSLDMDDLHGELRKSLLALTSLFHLLRFLPFDATFLGKIPIPLLRIVLPSAAELLLAKKRIRTQVKDTLGGKVTGGKRTVFTALMNPELPPAERSLQRLQDDGFLLLQAGSETTGQALSVLMFYVLRDPKILKKVKAELRKAMPDGSSRPSVTDLQALPYFSAVITEGMRLSFGTLTRLPRVAPDDAIQYGDWSIPAGTPVSQTAYFIHTNPEIFPDPQHFNPDRWIDAGENRKHLESILVNFSKGRRQCLGINLAHAEIYLAAAHMLRRVDMTLQDTDVDKIKPYRDRVIILPQKGYYDISVTIDETARVDQKLNTCVKVANSFNIATVAIQCNVIKGRQIAVLSSLQLCHK